MASSDRAVKRKLSQCTQNTHTHTHTHTQSHCGAMESIRTS